MRHFALLALVAALAASCTTTQGTSGFDVAVAKSAVDSLWTKYANAADQHDSTGFSLLFTEYATLAFDHAPTAVGNGAVTRALISRYAAFDATGFRVRPDDFKVSGTLAAQGGEFEEEGARNGKAETDHGRYVLVMERVADGSWRIARLTAFIDSIVPPGGAGKP